MRPLDGHINRLLEGKRISTVTKDGCAMTLHCQNGEQWAVVYANPETGEGLEGEPCLVAVDDFGTDPTYGAILSAPDGHIHRLLTGQTIEVARTDGRTLYLHLVGGRCLALVWIDSNTNRRVAGEPCLLKVDARVLAPPAQIMVNAQL